MLESCASTRIRSGIEREGQQRKRGSLSLGESVKDFNIAGKGFIIKRANIRFEGTPTEGSVTLIAKVNNKGDFIASIKGPLGIELARAISVDDSVFVVNRMEKVIMSGSREAMLNKAGMPKDIIGIIFGDMPELLFLNESANSTDKEIITRYSYGDYVSEIAVNINDRKVSWENIETQDGKVLYSLRFNNFKESHATVFPSTIEIDGKEKMFHVKINITDMEIGFRDKIELVLPRYRRVRL
ncbi:MAG: DUF4292 domain-containing protein [Bacteroidales bacterium]|nr:DUF4292 domain-containing protein [Bacteroidales bacterium]